MMKIFSSSKQRLRAACGLFKAEAGGSLRLRMIVRVTALLLLGGASFLIGRWWAKSRPPKPFTTVVTIAGTGLRVSATELSDPFGVVVDEDDNILVTDGRGGRLYRISPKGEVSLVTDQLDMPSAIALAPDGTLVVANTGAHTIVRVDPVEGRVKLVAGAPGISGDVDGASAAARFNGPVGVAVGDDGAIFVADTYNDRIRVITPDGFVRTLAGGRQGGFRDGRATEAQFHTPCGLALAPDGALLIADTGNHRIRRLDPEGEVKTLAGTGEAAERDGLPSEASFNEPMAIVLRDEHSFYVADGAGASLRLCSFGPQPSVNTITGEAPPGLRDGQRSGAQLGWPVGLALRSDGALIFADGGNGLVRALVPDGLRLGSAADPQLARLKAEEIRAAISPRWPFDPPQTRREIVGTFGEIRGERLPEREAWFHNGLDLPGKYGETVRAIFSERVLRPLAVESTGGPRERIHLGLLGYTHLRLGRDQNDRPLGNDGFLFQRDEEGRILSVRVRRGTRINAGDPLGTLNSLNHLHLIVGPIGAEINPLAALPLPGLLDTVPPVIESVTITNAAGEVLLEAKGESKRPARHLPPVPLSGRLRIIARAYDQVDGNAKRRRLGVYRLGYQLLNADGSPAAGSGEPHYNIIFDRLPADPAAAEIAYAEGSQSGYQGMTVFSYIVTNVVRAGVAREGFWNADAHAPGSYILRVIAEDLSGNRATRDVPVVIKSRP